jgi:hypothetical protein
MHMANAQLAQYVRENTAKGFTRDVVTKALTDAGWPPADISAAFAEFLQPTPAAAIPSPTTSPSVTVTTPPAQTSVPTVSTPVSAPPSDPGAAAFVAEMERRRQAAEALHPAAPVVQETARINVFAPEDTPQEKGIIGLLIRTKVVKDAHQANMVLVGIIIVVLSITIWINWLA